MECRDGELVLPGCDPEKGGTVWLFDPEHSLGHDPELHRRRRRRARRLTVTLQPCGAATVRMVDAKGKPLPGKHPRSTSLCLPARSWPPSLGAPRTRRTLEGDWHHVVELRPGALTANLKTDAEGRVTIPGLIPAAPHTRSDL